MKEEKLLEIVLAPGNTVYEGLIGFTNARDEHVRFVAYAVKPPRQATGSTKKARRKN